jgi:drug/metabolite transporter (DMT)-like permease
MAARSLRMSPFDGRMRGPPQAKVPPAAAAGDERGFHPGGVPARAWIALVYLIIAGSIVGFTAYTWLIHHQSPTKVGTYAYVNPVVAVVLGHFLGGEALDVRTVLGTVLVLASVIVITTRRRRGGAARRAVVTANSGAAAKTDARA